MNMNTYIEESSVNISQNVSTSKWSSIDWLPFWITKHDIQEYKENLYFSEWQILQYLCKKLSK